MVFSSYTFLFLFLPTLLAVYFLIPARLTSFKNLVLLLFSLLFYGCGGPGLLPLMLVSVAVNYLGGLLTAPGRGKGPRRAGLAAAVAANLGLLAWFKYAGFIAGNLAALGLPVAVPEITLPIGISFFTFQGMSYVLDVYRGDAECQRNPLWVALYVALFPQLGAGPSVRLRAGAAEIGGRSVSFGGASEGAMRFCFGFAKKLLLANILAEMADEVFSGKAALSAGSAWLGALAYTGQIYFDFSGYSDMAIGLGRMFGFHFLENFNYPYISRSVTEFWRRWHISLSSWFRDYLYIPLGGSRCARSRQLLNLLSVWLLTGLWHGAAWNFVLWGLYFAVLLMGERFLWGRLLERAPKAFRHLLTLLFVILGWVLFRADSLSGAVDMIHAMFGGAPFADDRARYLLREYGWLLAVASLASLPVRPALEKRLKPGGFLRVWGVPVLAAALLGLSFVRLAGSSFNPFIYYRF
jgi:alginate O-acetyltransferase complex protein AlgI